jgi:type VI protein secretion system component VasF
MRFGLRIMHTWLSRPFNRRSTAMSQSAPVPALPQNILPQVRLTDAQQMLRVSDIVTAAVTRTASIRQAHSSALEKLDAADYALARLLDDLADIMPVANPNREAVSTLFAVSSGRQSFEELRRRDREDAAKSLAAA